MSAPVFFNDNADWLAWLEKNHAIASEITIGFRKKGSGLPGISHRDAVDGALAYGWIDGVVTSIDETSYRTRFTPRKKGSIWSAVNIKRIGELSRAGQMQPAGLTAFQSRDPAKAKRYSFEQGELELLPDHAERLRRDTKAFTFFEAQPRTYRRAAIWWVISAKQEATRERRLLALIAESAAGRRLKQFVSPVAKYKLEKGG